MNLIITKMTEKYDANVVNPCEEIFNWLISSFALQGFMVAYHSGFQMILFNYANRGDKVNRTPDLVNAIHAL